MQKVYDFIRRVSAFLTPENRRALYLVLGALGALATGFGWLTETQVSDVTANVGHVLDVLALILAAAHVTPDAPESGAGSEGDA